MNPPESLTSPAKKPARWRRWLLEGLIFLALFIAFQIWQLRDTPHGTAPHFAGQLVDGSSFDLTQWRAAQPGKAVLLYFWADWCPVCKTTAGTVTALAADWPVTSIAVQSGAAPQVLAAMAASGYRWPTLPDPKAELLRQYGLPGTPAFIIIDPAGTIRFAAVGYTSEIGLRLRLWWASRENP